MNNISLVGRLTRDPEQRTTSSGKVYTKFSLAVRKRFKPKDSDERDADFFSCTVWGQSADYVANYGQKGRMVSVSGRIESRKYTNNEGLEKEVWEVTCEDVQFLDSPKDDNGQRTSNGNSRASASTARAASPAADEYDPFAED